MRWVPRRLGHARRGVVAKPLQNRHYVRVVDEDIRVRPGRNVVRSVRNRLGIGSIAVVVALSVAVWCMTSTIAAPGETWTAQTAAAPGSWNSVTYGNGLFVAVSNAGAHQVMTS